MARRQNHALNTLADDIGGFTLPNKIETPIDGLGQTALNFVNMLLLGYRFGNQVFDTTTPHHEDWVVLFVILTNEAAGRATVTKNIVEITGRAYGTVRSSLLRFEEMGLIESNQRIGRSDLYVPTKTLKAAINNFAEEFWPQTSTTRGRVK